MKTSRCTGIILEIQGGGKSRYPKIEGAGQSVYIESSNNTVNGELVVCTVNFQWKTFRRYITAKPKDDIKELYDQKQCVQI